jgi:hypothetical protein
VEIINGILFIKGAGKATIQAVSASNAYFEGVSVTRTFNIIPAVAVTYTFTGNGNWDQPVNWSNGTIPPAHLPSGSSIVINPEGDGQCILNVSQVISPGGKLTISQGKKFVVQKELQRKY